MEDTIVIPDKLPEDLNELAKLVHKCNEKWWQHPVTKERIERNKGELLMLVITELAEACEGERKDLMDDKLPHRKMAEVEMADAAIRLLDFAAGYGFTNLQPLDIKRFPLNKGEALLNICHMVSVLHRVLDMDYGDISPHFRVSQILRDIHSYCIQHGYDLYGAMREKLIYNLSRQDHTHEARLQPDGKKW